MKYYLKPSLPFFTGNVISVPIKGGRVLNNISLQLSLCIHFKKGYISNQEYTILSAIDADIYFVRICLIRLLFQENHFHQIYTTCNVSSIYIQNYMLASIFMLHRISAIQC